MKPKSNNQFIDSTNESPNHNITQISRENIMIKKTKSNAEDDLKTINISIVVVALAKYNNHKAGHYIIVHFKDVDGETRQLMIPACIVNDLRILKKLLIEHCFPYGLSMEVWKNVQELLNKGSAKRMQLVENPGFHNGVFLQADNKVIGKIAGGQSRPILDPTSKVRFPKVERKGKLAEWKSNIAVSALYSSRIMLTITAAFSSSLLKITDIESGGFHLYGKSSTGKSTCQYAAQSVQGSQDSIESWSLTETGAEELAAGHNDQLLVLDELGNLDSDPVKAAQKATKIIYTIAFGKDKRRSVNYTGERLSWRIIFISSGENSLTEHAAEGGTKRMLGEEVRLIDVPADAGNGLGIYEQLPDNISPAQYADDLKLRCKELLRHSAASILEKIYP